MTAPTQRPAGGPRVLPVLLIVAVILVLFPAAWDLVGAILSGLAGTLGFVFGGAFMAVLLLARR